MQQLLRDTLRTRGFTHEEVNSVEVYPENGRYKVRVIAVSLETSVRMVPLLVDAGLMTEPHTVPHFDSEQEVELTTGAGKTVVR